MEVGREAKLTENLSFSLSTANIGFGKRGLLEKGCFQKSHFLEILEKLEMLEILENFQTVENKGESNYFLEIFENLEILEIPPVKRPLSQRPLFPNPISAWAVTGERWGMPQTSEKPPNEQIEVGFGGVQVSGLSILWLIHTIRTII